MAKQYLKEVRQKNEELKQTQNVLTDFISVYEKLAKLASQGITITGLEGEQEHSAAALQEARKALTKVTERQKALDPIISHHSNVILEDKDGVYNHPVFTGGPTAEAVDALHIIIARTAPNYRDVNDNIIQHTENCSLQVKDGYFEVSIPTSHRLPELLKAMDIEKVITTHRKGNDSIRFPFEENVNKLINLRKNPEFREQVQTRFEEPYDNKDRIQHPEFYRQNPINEASETVDFAKRVIKQGSNTQKGSAR